MDLLSTARPAFKKRKLYSNASPSTDFSAHCSVHSVPPLNSIPLVLPTKSLICASCHRAFTSRPTHLVPCARCRAPTCTICARTCNACPPSAPPTPALTFSPSPPATPHPSPRRGVLALHTNTVKFTPGRRRKLHEDDDGATSGYEGCGKDTGAEASLGCGRVVCRNCCFESPQSDTTTCYDCCGRPHCAPTHVSAQGMGCLQVPIFA